jgi:hypothetical protein
MRAVENLSPPVLELDNLNYAFVARSSATGFRNKNPFPSHNSGFTIADKFPFLNWESTMRHFPLAMFAAFSCSFAPIATAQSSPAQVCVANMQSVNAGTGTAARDSLMKYLAKGKDKSVAQSIPIDASDPEPALQQAKDKKCDYLVTTNQTESHQENSLMTGTFGNTSTPTFYVTTAYKLTKVSDGSELAGGSLKASDHSSEQSAIGLTMHKIADKVTKSIKEAGPVTHS